MLGMPERLPPSLPPTTHARTARTSRTHATRARTHSLPCPQALVLMGEWETAYARVCTYLKIDYEDDAAELQVVALHCVVFLARPIGGAEGMVYHRGMASRGLDALLGKEGGIAAVLRSMRVHASDAAVKTARETINKN